MDNSQVAKIYSRALLEIANEKKILDEIQEELTSITNILTADLNIWSFLSSPIYKLEDRTQALEKSIKGNVSETLFDFLGVLMNHDRIEILKEIRNEFISGVDKIKGRIRAKLITGNDLGEKNIQSIQKVISEKFKSECVLENEVNESLIGGFTIQFNDMLIDRSIKNELAKIKQHLLHSKLPIGAISL